MINKKAFKNPTILKNYSVSFLIGFIITLCIILIPDSEGNKPLASTALFFNSSISALITFYFMSLSFTKKLPLSKHIRLGLKSSFMTGLLTTSLIAVELHLNEFHKYGGENLFKNGFALLLSIYYATGLLVCLPGILSSGLTLGFLNYQNSRREEKPPPLYKGKGKLKPPNRAPAPL